MMKGNERQGGGSDELPTSIRKCMPTCDIPALRSLAALDDFPRHS
jgi:hypothetical protein